MTRNERAELEAYREQQAREDAYNDYMHAEWRKELEEQREDGAVVERNSRGEGYDAWARNRLEEEAEVARREAEEEGF